MVRQMRPANRGLAAPATFQERPLPTDTTATTPARGPRATVRVWDPFVRLFHWTVAAGFFVAYFTDDDALLLHVWAGYVVGALVVMRLIWGFVGPRHARFGDFVYRPYTVWAYLIDLAAFRARRYLGHSPAGGVMALALLAGLLASVWTGLELYAVEEGAGPLAAVSTSALADEPDDDENDEDDEGDEFWEDLHEALADLTFALVLVHIGGVLLSSVVHRENLVWAMVTGAKRAED